MLDIVFGYQNLLDNIEVFIDNSKFKKEYIIDRLKISRATFYNKIKKRSFSVDEMVILSKILFPEEAKVYELKQALKESKADSVAGRVRDHEAVMNDVRKKLQG
ncbi:MAG: hypothetical protein H6584_02615 [Flavobacteriales bacterium]|nr:hypothetical protein [Flavobacteriales bacterium]